jgi:Transposase DDE domain
VLPAGTEVTILADRGFGDQKLFAFLTALGFAYVIRFRGNITVTDAQGKSRSAADWVDVGGRAHTLRGAKVTADEYPVGTVVCVHAKAMKEPWCLAASDPQGQTRTLINHYGKRWAIETSFRDTKDLRFGMGLGALHIASPERRDRLLLINAFAIVLLTLLGAAGESLGMDRHLKANTVKRRTHSLFRQGCMLYDLIPTMLEERLRPLIERFSQLLLQHRAFSETFCVV